MDKNLKKGTKIILKKSLNGMESMEEEMFIIDKKYLGYYQCKNCKTGDIWSIYSSDDFCLADKKEQIKYLNGEITKQNKKITEMKKEIDFLEKYEDEAEFVAEKIDNLFKAKGVKAKAKILRELKKSNYI